MRELADIATTPSGIALLTILTFAITLTVLYWREGAFSHFFVAKGATIEAGSKSWMLGNQRHRARPASHGSAHKAVTKVSAAAQDSDAVAAAPAESAPADAAHVEPLTE